MPTCFLNFLLPIISHVSLCNQKDKNNQSPDKGSEGSSRAGVFYSGDAAVRLARSTCGSRLDLYQWATSSGPKRVLEFGKTYGYDAGYVEGRK
jgi:hypothetical protein